MRQVRRVAALFVCCLFVRLFAEAQNVSPIMVTKESGGSIKTSLSATIQINDKSSLNREFIAVHNVSLPVDLVGTPGVRTVYVDDRMGTYRYIAEVPIKVKEAVSAIEYRFILFDIWGDHVRTLTATVIEDLAPDQVKSVSPKWNVPFNSESEVSDHYASIGYIARVRTTAGRVVEADPAAVLNEVRQFSKKFSVADLEPSKQKQ